jgi:hypothetical protein
MEKEIIKATEKLCKDLIYWSTVKAGCMTKYGMTEFSMLAEIVVPGADDILRKIKKLKRCHLKLKPTSCQPSQEE